MLTTVQTPLKSMPRVTPYSWPAESAGLPLRFCPFCCCLAFAAFFFCGPPCRKAGCRQPHNMLINWNRVAEAACMPPGCCMALSTSARTGVSLGTCPESTSQGKTVWRTYEALCVLQT